MPAVSSTADCFAVCGQSLLTVSGDDKEPLWLDEEKRPSGEDAWTLGCGEIDVQESISFTWNTEDENCMCEIDGEEMEGELFKNEKGIFFEKGNLIQCLCEFDCHLT